MTVMMRMTMSTMMTVIMMMLIHDDDDSNNNDYDNHGYVAVLDGFCCALHT